MSNSTYLDLKDILYHDNWIDSRLADQAFDELIKLPWKNEHIKMFGRMVKVPRKVIWIGDPGSDYMYSGVWHSPSPWPGCLQSIRSLVSEKCGCEFNSALLNLYENGRDYMGWHSDDEVELGPEPCIASLSLGVSRRFLLKSKITDTKYEYVLNHGSLLVMKGKTQELYKHSLPKMLRVNKKRINITFLVSRGFKAHQSH